MPRSTPRQPTPVTAGAPPRRLRAAASRASELPGTLGGRYRIGEVIGRGGMSTVYRAQDAVLDRDVAVKVLLPALVDQDPVHLARFEREARAVAALHHPGVVKVYDTGTDRGAHFIVMEYVRGRSLAELLRAGRPLPADEAVRIATQVAEALAAAHAAGILHRDIKPANVMTTGDDQVKVLDFGIARGAGDTTLTLPATAPGTAAYMPPERVLGRGGDERSDIYGLGCLLYAMLVGRPPFVADESVAVLHQQVHADPPPPRERGVVLAPALEALVLRMLAKDPSDRPQTASEVATLLSGAAALETGDATAATLRQPVAAAPLATHRARRRLVPWALAAATALVLLLIAITSGGSGPHRAATHRPPATKTTPIQRVQTHQASTATTPPTTPAVAPPSAGPPPKHDHGPPPKHAKPDGKGPKGPKAPKPGHGGHHGSGGGGD